MEWGNGVGWGDTGVWIGGTGGIKLDTETDPYIFLHTCEDCLTTYQDCSQAESNPILTDTSPSEA